MVSANILESTHILLASVRSLNPALYEDLTSHDQVKQIGALVALLIAKSPQAIEITNKLALLASKQHTETYSMKNTTIRD